MPAHRICEREYFVVVVIFVSLDDVAKVGIMMPTFVTPALTYGDAVPALLV